MDEIASTPDFTGSTNKPSDLGESSSGIDRPNPQVLEALLLVTLHQTGIAIFIVNSNRELTYASPRGALLLQKREHFSLIDGKLATSSARSTARLTAFADGGDGEGNSSFDYLAVPCQGRTPLIIHVVAMPSARGDREVLLLCRPSIDENADHGVLRAVFKLTPAELRIACLLSAGLTVEQTAERQKTHVQTVRKQLRGIFAKTQTNRQAQLVELVLRSTFMLGGAVAPPPSIGRRMSQRRIP